MSIRHLDVMLVFDPDGHERIAAILVTPVPGEPWPTLVPLLGQPPDDAMWAYARAYHLPAHAVRLATFRRDEDD